MIDQNPLLEEPFTTAQLVAWITMDCKTICDKNKALAKDSTLDKPTVLGEMCSLIWNIKNSFSNLVENEHELSPEEAFIINQALVSAESVFREHGLNLVSELDGDAVDDVHALAVKYITETPDEDLLPSAFAPDTLQP